MIFTRQWSHVAAVPKPTEAPRKVPHTQGQQLGLQGRILAPRAVQGSCKVKAGVSEQRAQLATPRGDPWSIGKGCARRPELPRTTPLPQPPAPAGPRLESSGQEVRGEPGPPTCSSGPRRAPSPHIRSWSTAQAGAWRGPRPVALVTPVSLVKDPNGPTHFQGSWEARSPSPGSHLQTHP